MKLEFQEIRLKGIPICRGVAIGKLWFHVVDENDNSDHSFFVENIEEEITRYRHALERSREELKSLQKQLEKDQTIEGAAILEAQFQILHDPFFIQSIENAIRSHGKNAESVFQEKINEYQKKFQSLSNPFFRDRFNDVLDVSKRVMRYLRQSAQISLSKAPVNSVIFSKELTAIDIAEASVGSACALVTKFGEATTHAAIIARSKEIPYVSGIDLQWNNSIKNEIIIVDGRTGDVILNPSAETLTHYCELCDSIRCHRNKLNCLKSLKTETFDGYSINLSANIEIEDEVEIIHQHGGTGVGLFRSEYIFLSKGTFPSEEEQFQIYKNIAKKMKGLPFVIRAFDIGGDKCLPNQDIKEKNPFLGCRAIRFLLKERDLFRAQICAILRASDYGNIRLLFPFISTLEELLDAKNVLREAQQELQERGEKQKRNISIGCMIEVPSAALIADLLAKECDFLSIGTNDLVQYSLAVDRNNHLTSALYTPTHPSILRLIRLVVNEANRHKIPVTVCGEVAADPRFTALLLGLGVHELSVAANALPTIKNAIRNTSIVAANRLATRALSLSSISEIYELLIQEYKMGAPEDCLFNPIVYAPARG